MAERVRGATVTKSETEKEQISRVLEDFDFEKVHRVMVFLDWKWWTGRTPTVPELIDTGTKLIRDAFEDNEVEFQTVENGGLMVIRTPNGLQLIFKAAQATCSVESAAWAVIERKKEKARGGASE